MTFNTNSQRTKNEKCQNKIDSYKKKKYNTNTTLRAFSLTESTHIGSVDSGRPPQGESTVGDLVQTGPLGVGQFLVLHGLFKSARLLPVTTLRPMTYHLTLQFRLTRLITPT